MYGIIDKKQIFGKLNYLDKNVLKENDEGAQDKLKPKKSKRDIEFIDEAHQNSNLKQEDIYNTNPNINDNTGNTHKELSHIKESQKQLIAVANRRPTNPNQFDAPDINKNNHTINGNESDEEFEEDFYADELGNYNVTPEEIKNHFSFLFFNQNENNNSTKKLIKRNTAKTIQTIKNMKHTQSKLKMHMNLKKATWRSPRKKQLKV
jgi:hypothetical protein